MSNSLIEIKKVNNDGEITGIHYTKVVKQYIDKYGKVKFINNMINILESELKYYQSFI